MTTHFTTSYYRSIPKELVEGLECFFGQLWDGEGDGQALLESGAVHVSQESGAELLVSFKVVKDDQDTINALEEGNLLDVWVRVTDVALFPF